MKSQWILAILALLIVGWAFAQSSDDSAPRCSRCRCYKINCSRIDNPDIDCENDFKDSCDHPDEITEENGCSMHCDCCLKGGCYAWYSYNCIMHRTYEITTTLNFLFICINYFVIWRVFKQFFYLRQNVYDTKKKKDDAKRHRRLAEEKYFYRYKQIFWVNWNPGDDKKNADDPHITGLKEMALQIAALKPIAVKNVIVIGCLTFLWLLAASIDLYCIVALAEEPFTYVEFAWIQHFLLIAFWAIVWLSFYVLQPYRTKVLELVTRFEENNKCTVIIKRKVQTIEVKSKVAKETDSVSSNIETKKESAKNLTGEDSISAGSLKDLDKDFDAKINKLNLKDEKPKIRHNKIKPL
jgi:hypothetical protein